MNHLQNLIRYFTIIFTLLWFSGCKSTKTRGTNSDTKFKIEVVQDNKIIPIKKNKVKLKKKPFKFRITLYNTEYLSVSASFGKYYYDYPEDKNIYECNDKETLEGCRFVAIKTGMEAHFNEGRLLGIGNENVQFDWFYSKSVDWHRYDTNIVVTGNTVIAEKTIENILDMELRSKRIDGSVYEYPIENIEKDIYMVFATDYYKSGMENPEELQREKFILSFK